MRICVSLTEWIGWSLILSTLYSIFLHPIVVRLRGRWR